jgi:hypothetical protein
MDTILTVMITILVLLPVGVIAYALAADIALQLYAEWRNRK